MKHYLQCIRFTGYCEWSLLWQSAVWRGSLYLPGILETESVSVQYLATNMLHQGKAIKKLSTNESRNVQLSDRDCGMWSLNNWLCPVLTQNSVLWWFWKGTVGTNTMFSCITHHINTWWWRLQWPPICWTVTPPSHGWSPTDTSIT